MHYTVDEIFDHFENSDEKFLIADGPYHFDPSGQPYCSDLITIIVADQGTVTFSSRDKKYIVGNQHVVLLTKDPSLHFDGISPDFKCTSLIFSKKFWQDKLMHINPYNNLSILRPALESSQSERESILEFIDCLKVLQEREIGQGSPLTLAVIRGLMNTLGDMYEKWALSFSKSSDAMLFVRFARRLFDNYKSHREVSWYADQEEMSNASFSQHVKELCGMTALNFIHQFTMLKLCTELRETSKSIKQLAIEFNFSDSSHFCRFFRTNIGESPDTYRNSVMLHTV